jgi:hypothetical protein
VITFSNLLAAWRSWIAPALALVFFLSALAARGSMEAASPEVGPGGYDPSGFKAMWTDQETSTPVRYNPCAPIHYVINPTGAPDGAIEDVHAAFRMTSEASGIRFVYEGATGESPVFRREPYQPDLYGQRWAPVLIAWAPLDEGVPAGGEEGNATVGRGGSVYRANRDGRAVYVSGSAVFDPSADLNPGFAGQTWGQVILHELGHVLGLDHVDDPGSVMNPVVGLRPAMWGGVDRAGLWDLGMGSPCLAVPDTP